MNDKQHPVVRAYIETDMSLRSILNIHSDGSSVCAALELLVDFQHGKQSANGAFLAARKVDIQGLNSELCILFLSTWASAALIQASEIPEQLAAAWTLVHRAKALFTSDTPPEIRVCVSLVEAKLTGAEGDSRTCENTIRTALQSLSNSSMRRKFAVLDLASLLACKGRLADIKQEMMHLNSQTNINFRIEWVQAAEFINMIETGHTEQADKLASLLASTETTSDALRRFTEYRTLLELLKPQETSTSNNEKEPDITNLPDWALSIHCLLNGSVHQGLRWARVHEKRSPSSLTGINCISYNLIRAELAEGNIDASKRLLDLRHNAGNINYIDDFFSARIALLSGEKDKAADHFSSLMQNIRKYDASGRLEIELRMAAEIPRDILLNLTLKSESIRISDLQSAWHQTVEHKHEPRRVGIENIIGISRETEDVRRKVSQFAHLDVPVLITGETGTGKEVAAKALHDASPRYDEPFVAINCGAISDSLLESELFGHEKGAFSGAAAAHQGLFEEAGRGTIFLDEIGEISQRLQVALLRVLETGDIRPVGSSRSRKINCRIIASTNADIQDLSSAGRFRQDLVYRLKRLEIHILPLRERTDDIVPLAVHFLNLDRAKDFTATMSDRLIDTLRVYPWPGNVRELKNTIERMRLMNSDKLYYDYTDIDLMLPGVSAPGLSEPAMDQPSPILQQPRAVRSIGRTVKLKTGKSSIRRLEMLRKLFRDHRVLTRAEIIDTMNISPNTATKYLKVLTDEGYIRKEQPSPSPRSAYFVLNLNLD